MRRRFKPTEVLSSDFFRALLSDDEMDQSVSKDAFDLLYLVAGKRLAGGRLTVLDATHVSAEGRQAVLDLARKHHVWAIAIVLNVPEAVCLAHNALRPGHDVPASVIHAQYEQFGQALRHLGQEGFAQVVVLNSPQEIEAATIVRRPLPCTDTAEFLPSGPH